MSAIRSFVTGLGRVLSSPGLIVGLLFLSLLVVAPLAHSMRATLEESIGSSLVDEKLTEGFDLDWYGEFSADANGLAATFGPSVTGILPMLGNLERLFDGTLLRIRGPILLAGVVFLLGWAFLAGGIIDRYADVRGQSIRSQFLAQCGEYFFRFVRLQIIAVGFYWLIFRWVGNPLHQLVTSRTRDVTVEGTVMVYTVLVYALVAYLLALVSMAMDYAKISLVVEHRYSAIGGFLRGLGFVFSNFFRTVGLYLLLAVVGATLFYFYSLVAPGAGQSSWATVLFAFLIGQLYLVARIVLKLWFLASQTHLFQSAGNVSGSPGAGAAL